MTGKYEFASEAWIKAMEQQAQILLDSTGTASDAKFVYCENLTNPPAPRADGKMTGYILQFSGKKVSAVSGLSGGEPADCTVQMDFAAACATMGAQSGPALTALARQAYADGKMSMTGSPAGAPISMNDLHDAMLGLTLPAASE